MILLRLLLLLGGLLLALCVGAYAYTRDPGYLRFAWQLVRFAAVLLLVFAALLVLERYVLVGWRVLL